MMLIENGEREETFLTYLKFINMESVMGVESEQWLVFELCWSGSYSEIGVYMKPLDSSLSVFASVVLSARN